MWEEFWKCLIEQKYENYVEAANSSGQLSQIQQKLRRQVDSEKIRSFELSRKANIAQSTVN